MQQVKLKVSLLSSKVRISLLMERNSPTSVVITLTSNVIMNLFLQHWLAITAPTQLLSHPYSQFHSSLFHHLVNTWHCNIVSIKAYVLCILPLTLTSWCQKWDPRLVINSTVFNSHSLQFHYGFYDNGPTPPYHELEVTSLKGGLDQV